NQKEIDYFWDELSAGGEIQQCGWLKDKFGLSWQVVPDSLPWMLSPKHPKRANRVMQSVLAMKKLDIDVLEAAYEGKTPKPKASVRKPMARRKVKKVGKRKQARRRTTPVIAEAPIEEPAVASVS